MLFLGTGVVLSTDPPILGPPYQVITQWLGPRVASLRICTCSQLTLPRNKMAPLFPHSYLNSSGQHTLPPIPLKCHPLSLPLRSGLSFLPPHSSLSFDIFEVSHLIHLNHPKLLITSKIRKPITSKSHQYIKNKLSLTLQISFSYFRGFALNTCQSSQTVNQCENAKTITQSHKIRINQFVPWHIWAIPFNSSNTKLWNAFSFTPALNTFNIKVPHNH